ncbi:MAG: thioredoxin family protein [Armatimonadetes bacterium]|nr:thioredoxin family protein [Armatimonadota bacterium]
MKDIPRPPADPFWQPSSPAIENPEALHRLLSRSPVVVLHFWAIWNGYDPRMDDLLNPLQKEFEGGIIFGSVNVDDEAFKPFTVECGILNIPALACFIRGSLHEILIGLRNKETFRLHFNDWLRTAEG